MPLELGLFLGAKRYGNKRQKTKSCKIPILTSIDFRNFVLIFQDKISLPTMVIRKKLSKVYATGSVRPGAIF
jgi:hypothetical protein